MVALAALLRIPTLGQQSYWFDESQTVVLMRLPFSGMIHGVYTNETTPQLYFIVAWAWSQLVGDGEFGLRFVSAIAGVLTVPVAFLIARQLSSARAGVIAAALTACSPMLVWYSQEARAYSLVVLLASLTVLTFVKLRDQLTLRWIFAWAVAGCLALSAHYFNALLVIPEGAWLLWRYRRDRRILFALMCVVACCAGFLPEELHQAQAFPGGGGWISLIPLGKRLEETAIEQLLGPSRILTPVTLGIDLLVVSVAITVLCRSRAVLRTAAPSLALFLCGLALFALAIVTGHDLLIPRNILPIWMAFTVTISIGLASWNAGPYRVLAVAMMCAVGVATVVAVDVDNRLQRPQWRQVAHAVGERSGAALLQVNGCQGFPLYIYMPTLSAPLSEVDAKTLYVLATVPEPSNFDVLMKDWYTICTPVGKVVFPAAIRGFRRTGGVSHYGQFMLQRYVARRAELLSSEMLAESGLQGQLRLTLAPLPSPINSGCTPAEPLRLACIH